MGKRVLVASFLVIVLAATAYGAAAALGVGGGVIQSGGDSDLTCDGDGVKVAGWGFETDTNKVSFVRVTDIAAACEGKALGVRVDGPGGFLTSVFHDPIASGETGTGSAKVNLDSAQDAGDIVHVQITIEGGE
jgi:hypothetical protein